MFAKIKTFRKYSTKKVDSVKYFYFPQNYKIPYPFVKPLQRKCFVFNNYSYLSN